MQKYDNSFKVLLHPTDFKFSKALKLRMKTILIFYQNKTDVQEKQAYRKQSTNYNDG
jgi:hypothetical protein